MGPEAWLSPAQVTGWKVGQCEFPLDFASDSLCDLGGHLAPLGLSFPICAVNAMGHALVRNLPSCTESGIPRSFCKRSLESPSRSLGGGQPFSPACASSAPSPTFRGPSLRPAGFPPGQGFSQPDLPGMVGENAKRGICPSF